MSELNTYYIPTRSGNSCLCYLKSDADKVIAELKHDVAAWMDSYEVSRKTNARTESELRYQKYKRCLAMYRYCSIRALYELDFKGNDVEWKWYSKWMHKWFNLAEKFKEEK